MKAELYTNYYISVAISISKDQMNRDCKLTQECTVFSNLNPFRKYAMLMYGRTLSEGEQQILFSSFEFWPIWSSREGSECSLVTWSVSNFADKSGAEKEVAAAPPPELQSGAAHKMTEEEGMRLAKEYSRFLMKELRLRTAAENVRLQLKKEAIAALPPHLREKALLPDFTPFPPTRIPASLTPPIPGYVEEMTKSAEQSAKIQKMR